MKTKPCVKQKLKSLRLRANPQNGFNVVVEENLNLFSETGLILPTYCGAKNIRNNT